MIYKKLIILPAGFILIHIFYIGCCGCKEGTFHRDITALRGYELSHVGLNTRDTVFVADTLFADLNINYDYIVKNNANPFSSLVNKTYALSCNNGCDNFIDSGFKYKFDSLTITSNNNFKGIPAGQNIASFFTAMYYNNIFASNTTIQYISIPQLIDSLNIDRRNSAISLFTNTSAPTYKNHHFKYTLFSDGKVYEANSPRIVIWQ